MGKGSVYQEDDWLDVGEFLRRKAEGKDPLAISRQLKFELAQKVVESPIFTIRNFFYTIDKNGELILTDPWAGQVMLDLCIESQRRRGSAQAVVEIKPRQVGWTQWVLSRISHRVLRPNTLAMILMNDEDVAERLMVRINTIYNNLPKWMRPMKRIDNTKSLIFDNPNNKDREINPGLNSQIMCTVPSGIRGITPNFFAWSEAAFCRDYEIVVDSVLNAMGLNANFCTIIDTTPNGKDEFYYPMVLEAVDRNPKWVASWMRKDVPTREELISGAFGEPDRPKEGFVPAFFPMQWHPEYTSQNEDPQGQLPWMSPEDVDEVKRTLGKLEKYGGDEELDLMERLGLSIYRIAWRREKINKHTAGADFHERLLTFRQEHATEWQSCFVTHGRGAFDSKGMDVLRRGIKPPFARGCLRRDSRNKIYIDTTFQSDWLDLKFWVTPEPGESYVIGVDGANVWHSEDSDFTYATVLRRSDLKQVAVMQAKTPPDIWRDQLFELYHWYNRAYLGIEMEGTAIPVAYELYVRGCTHQYWYRNLDVDPLKGPGQGLGWETNHKTRWKLQNALVELIAMRDEEGKASPGFTLRDEVTMQQLSDVTRNADGKIGNWNHGKDDAFMALGIALAIAHDEWDTWRKKKEKASEPPKENKFIRTLGYRHGRYTKNHPVYDNL